MVPNIIEPVLDCAARVENARARRASSGRRTAIARDSHESFRRSYLQVCRRGVRAAFGPAGRMLSRPREAALSLMLAFGQAQVQGLQLIDHASPVEALYTNLTGGLAHSNARLVVAGQLEQGRCETHYVIQRD